MTKAKTKKLKKFSKKIEDEKMQMSNTWQTNRINQDGSGSRITYIRTFTFKSLIQEYDFIFNIP